MLRAFEVTGESMAPALRPGDRLLVRDRGEAAAGRIVVARHPHRRELLIVKRATGRVAGGWWLESDNQGAPGRQDSWDFDAVSDELVVGPVVARYWPPSRLSISRSAFSRSRAR